MDLDLSPFFKTKAQAKDFATRLSRVSDQIYSTSFNLDKVLTEQLGLQKKDAFLTLLSNNGVNTSNNIELKKIFDTIIAQVSSTPVLSLTIAIEPNENLMQSLADWCLLNLGKQAIFEIQINPRLIAGASISYNGKFLDLSLKPRFEQLFTGMTAPKKNPTSQNPASIPTGGQ